MSAMRAVPSFRRHTAAMLTVLAALALSPGSSGAGGAKNEIRTVEHRVDGATTRVRIRGTSTPTFTVYKLDDPARVVVDLSNAVLAADDKQTFELGTWSVGQVSAHATGPRGRSVVRVVVGMARPATYKVMAVGNDVEVRVKAREPAPATAPAVGSAEVEAAQARASAARREAARARAAAAAARGEKERLERALAAEKQRLEQALASESARADARAAEAARKARAEAARLEQALADESARADAAAHAAARARADAEAARRRAEAAIADARREATAARAAAEERARQAASTLARAEEMLSTAERRMAEVEKMRREAEAARGAAAEAEKLAAERQAAARTAAREASEQRARAEAARDAAARAQRAAEAARAGTAEARALIARADEAAREASERRARAEAAARQAEAKRRAAEKAAEQAESQKRAAERAVRVAQERREQADRERAQAEAARARAEERAAAADKRREQAVRAAAEAEAHAARARTLHEKEETALARAEKARKRAEERRLAAERAARELQAAVVAAREAKKSATAQRERAEQAAREAAAAEAARKSRAEIARARAHAERLAEASRQAEAELGERRRAVTSSKSELARLEKRQRDAADELDGLRSAADRVRAAREKEEAALAALLEERRRAEAALARAEKERDAARAEAHAASVRADRERAAADAARAARAEAEREARREAEARRAEETRRETENRRAEQARRQAEARRAEAGRRRATRPSGASPTAMLAMYAPTVVADAGAVPVAAPAGAKTSDERKERDARAKDARAKDARAKDARAKDARAKDARAKNAKAPSAPRARVRSVEFVDGDDAASVVIQLSRTTRARVLAARGKRAVLEIHSAALPESLQKKLDTRKYRGPIAAISSYRHPRDATRVRVVVDLAEPVAGELVREGKALHWRFPKPAPTRTAAGEPRNRTRSTSVPPTVVGSYGTSSTPITQKTVSQLAGRQRKVYRGVKIDLDFKDADIHNILRLLADVGGVNIVVPDEVKARVTVRLRRVPWDQALDVILASKGLGYRRQGNLYRIAPQKQLDAEDQAEAERLRAMVQAEAPEPEIFTLNYAVAKDIRAQLAPLLSPKGRIEVDERTNSLIINDIRAHRRRIIELVTRLDTQTPQIQIEARIVEARSTFTREFGIQWGGNAAASAATGNATGLVFPNSAVFRGGADDGQTNATGVSAVPSDFAVNLPAAVGSGSGGAIGVSLGSVGGAFNINLRLSALEDQGSVRIISAPKITVMNNIQAEISQGVSIPISVISANGVQTQFVPADLALKVTPYVSQRDCSIAMDLEVTKNEADFVNTGARGDPTILRKEAKTRLLVADGETTVLGGIYTRNTGLAYSKVPFLGDLPVLGWLFKNRSENDERTEVLVFITPKITNKAFLRCE